MSNLNDKTLDPRDCAETRVVFGNWSATNPTFENTTNKPFVEDSQSEFSQPPPSPPAHDRLAAGQEHKASWGNPDLFYLGTGRSVAPPFPAHRLGAFWDDWSTAQAAARSCPVDYIVATLFTVTSGLIGISRVASPTPEWNEPPLLWIMKVGSPSSGKSPAADPVLEPIRDIERRWLEAAKPQQEAYREAINIARAKQTAWEARLREAAAKGEEAPARPADAREPARPPRPCILVNDTTAEKIAEIVRDNPRGVILHRDELAGFLGSFGRYSGNGAERAFWLEAYGGRPYKIDRVKHPEPILVDYLSITVLGGIQPDRAQAVMSGDDDGLASRFLYAWPDPICEFTLQRRAIDSSRQHAALQRLATLPLLQDQDGRVNQVKIRLSEAAEARFEEFVREIRKEAPGAIGLTAGALGKAPGHVLRLALVLTYLRWAPEPTLSEPFSVEADAMVDAIALVKDYFLPMANRVFGEAALPHDQRAAIVLARWLRHQRLSFFNARDARRGPNAPLRENKDMDIACELLAEAGLIRRQDGKGKRKDFEVNPVLRGEGDGL